jgi:hypothetical protein
MKRIFALLVICVCGLILAMSQTANSISQEQEQDTIEHLKFLDIPIDGKVSTFVTKLQGKGFKKEQEEQSMILLSGIFAGQSCPIAVVASPKTHTAYRVGILLPEERSWNSLKQSYNNWKKRYISKYGEAKDSNESFENPEDEKLGRELYALSNDKCNYSTVWEVNGGTITIRLSGENALGGHVMIVYDDAINESLANREVQDEI